jgi:putative membrane protein
MSQGRTSFSLILKGMAMGIAEVIPGVSGGTIAFITGIYERLINAIKAVGPGLFTTFKQDGVKGVWSALDGNFLLFLVGGMVGGVVIGVLGVTSLIESQSEILWAFFFGLIIASSIYIAKQISNWSITEIIALILGAVFAYAICTLSPAEGSNNPLFIILCGAIAISALILPGISGSFILLILGMYAVIIPNLKNALTTFEWDSIQILLLFGSGCLIGLMTFSRVLSWTFKNYKNVTLATMTGFILGSLSKIWPWRNPQIWQDDAGLRFTDIGGMASAEVAELKVLVEENVMPTAYDGDPKVMFVVIAMVVGFALVFVLERFSGE